MSSVSCLSGVSGIGIIARMPLGERIEKSRKEKGLSQAKLGKSLGVTRNAVSLWESNTSSPQPERLRELAVILDKDFDWLATGRRRHSLVTQGLPLWGEIAAGVWSEVGENQEMEVKRVPVAPDPAYPADAQYALKVKGNSVNRIAPDGTIIVVVDIIKAGIEVREGDLVWIERRKGTLVETTLKRIRKVKGRLELWPESDDPRHKEPVRLGANGETEVTIKGLVIYTLNPIARGE